MAGQADSHELHWIQERLHLLAGTKRRAVIPAPADALAEIAAQLSAAGFASEIRSPDGLGTLAPGPGEGYVFAGRDARCLDEIRSAYLEERRAFTEGKPDPEHTRRMGRLLGYPDCCVEAFLELENRDDGVLARRLFYDSASVPDPRLFRLPRGSASLLLHTPCRLDCEASNRIARAVMDAARNIAPEYARLVDDLARLPVLFFSENRYLRLSGAERTPEGLRFGGLRYGPGERDRLDADFPARFERGGLLKHSIEETAVVFDDGGRDFLAAPEDVLRPFLFDPDTFSRPRPARVLFVQTFPNEFPQALSGFFPNLYTGDLALNGVFVRHLALHPRPGDADFNRSLNENALEIAKKEHIGSVFFFRTFPPDLADGLARELPDVPRVLIDNTTPRNAGNITHFLSIGSRAAFLRAVLSLASEGPLPEGIRPNAKNGPPLQDVDVTRFSGPLVDPAQPLHAPVPARMLNASAAAPSDVLEILARPGCPYRRDAARNPVFEGLDLSGVTYRKGCSFCTTRTPWFESVSDEEVLDSLLFQIRKAGEFGAIPSVIRVLDQGFLPLVPELLRRADTQGIREVSWRLDLRVSDIISENGYLEQAVLAASRFGHRLDPFCIGFENFSDAELQRFNKGTTAAMNRKAARTVLRLVKEHPETLRGPGGASGFVLFTPWTTPEDLAQNRDAFLELDFSRFRSAALFTRLRLYPDNPLFLLAEKDGLLLERYEDTRRDGSARFGYAPDIPWRFADDTVRRVYDLLLLLADHPGRMDEGEILDRALRHAAKHPETADEDRRFVESVRPLLHFGGLPDEGEKDASGERETPPGEARDIPDAVRQAIRTREKRLETDGPAFDSCMELAELYVSVGRREKALGRFLQAGRLEPGHPDPLLRVAELLIQLDRPERARELLTRSRSRFRDANALEKLAKLLRRIENATKN